MVQVIAVLAPGDDALAERLGNPGRAVSPAVYLALFSAAGLTDVEPLGGLGHVAASASASTWGYRRWLRNPEDGHAPAYPSDTRRRSTSTSTTRRQ